MLTIFAKKDTTQKAAVICGSHDRIHVMASLKELYGGSWVYVDVVNVSHDEILIFDDGYTYHGFDGMRSRYCDAIKQMR